MLRPLIVFAGSKPDCVPGGKNPSYNPNQYLIGLGIAPVIDEGSTDIQKADNAARAKIAKQIRVSLYEDLLM
jgi:hypothetical protein